MELESVFVAHSVITLLKKLIAKITNLIEREFCLGVSKTMPEWEMFVLELIYITHLFFQYSTSIYCIPIMIEVL